MVKYMLFRVLWFYCDTYVTNHLQSRLSHQNQIRPNTCIIIDDNKAFVAGASPSPTVTRPMANDSAQGFSNTIIADRTTS